MSVREIRILSPHFRVLFWPLGNCSMAKIVRPWRNSLKFIPRPWRENCMRSRKDPGSFSAERTGEIPARRVDESVRLACRAKCNIRRARPVSSDETGVKVQPAKSCTTYPCFSGDGRSLAPVDPHNAASPRRLNTALSSSSPPKDRPLDSTDNNHRPTLRARRKNINSKIL